MSVAFSCIPHADSSSDAVFCPADLSLDLGEDGKSEEFGLAESENSSSVSEVRLGMGVAAAIATTTDASKVSVTKAKKAKHSWSLGGLLATVGSASKRRAQFESGLAALSKAIGRQCELPNMEQFSGRCLRLDAMQKDIHALQTALSAYGEATRSFTNAQHKAIDDLWPLASAKNWESKKGKSAIGAMADGSSAVDSYPPLLALDSEAKAAERKKGKRKAKEQWALSKWTASMRSAIAARRNRYSHIGTRPESPSQTGDCKEHSLSDLSEADTKELVTDDIVIGQTLSHHSSADSSSHFSAMCSHLSDAMFSALCQWRTVETKASECNDTVLKALKNEVNAARQCQASCTRHYGSFEKAVVEFCKETNAVKRITLSARCKMHLEELWSAHTRFDDMVQLVDSKMNSEIAKTVEKLSAFIS